jgi:hypothetical protein
MRRARDWLGDCIYPGVSRKERWRGTEKAHHASRSQLEKHTEGSTQNRELSAHVKTSKGSSGSLTRLLRSEMDV